MSPLKKPSAAMNFLWRWLQRGSIVATASRFSLVGALATATYLIVANALIVFTDMRAASASVIAYCVGMGVSFLGQSRFTFRVTRNTLGQAARFSVLSICGLVISYFSVGIADGKIGVHPFWGTLATAIFVPALSFVIMKFWVFEPDS